MGFTNETLHYGIPLPLGSDLTTPMDYNQAAEAIDAAIFQASTDAAGAASTAGTAQAAAAEAQTSAANAVADAATAHGLADTAVQTASAAQTAAESAQTAATAASGVANAASAAVSELDREVKHTTADVSIPYTTATTREQILASIVNVIDFSKLTPVSTLFLSNTAYRLAYTDKETTVCFSDASNAGSDGHGFIISLQASTTAGNARAWMCELTAGGVSISNIMSNPMNRNGTAEIYYN